MGREPITVLQRSAGPERRESVRTQGSGTILMANVWERTTTLRACPQLKNYILETVCQGTEPTMRRYALRDDQWERIKDWLPGRDGHVGVTAKDNRLFVEAVVYR